MANKKYSYKDYYKPSVKEQSLWSTYNAASTKDDKENCLSQIKKMRGVVSSEEEEYVSDRLFAKYLTTVFKVIYINSNVAFYNWKHHHYEFIDVQIYLGFFKNLLDQMDEKLWNSKMEGRCYKRFIRDIEIKLKEFQIPEDYVVFNNGSLQLSTGKFLRGDRPDIIFNTCCTGYDYDASATCPEFLKFIKDIFNEDAKLIAVVQEMSGNTFCYGCNPMQVITILIGRGRNGKGVFCNMVQKTHGEQNCASTSTSQLSSKFGLSQMFDKVLNISN
jgi:putative DNA primase/helicase